MKVKIKMVGECQTGKLLRKMSKIIGLQQELEKHRADGASSKFDAGVTELISGEHSKLPETIEGALADVKSYCSVENPCAEVIEKTAGTERILSECMEHAEAIAAAVKSRNEWRKRDAEISKELETELVQFVEECRLHRGRATVFLQLEEKEAIRAAEERAKEINDARKKKAEAEERLRNLGA